MLKMACTFDWSSFLWSFTWSKCCNLTVLNDFIFDQTSRLRYFKGRSGHKNQTFGRFCVFHWHEAYTRVCFTLLLAATNWLHQDLGHSWRFQYNLTTRAGVLRTVSNLEVLLITSYFKPRRSLLIIMRNFTENFYCLIDLTPVCL